MGVVKLYFVIICWRCNVLPLARTVDWLAVLDENMMLSVVAGEGVVDGRVFPEWHSHTLTV